MIANKKAVLLGACLFCYIQNFNDSYLTSVKSIILFLL